MSSRKQWLQFKVAIKMWTGLNMAKNSLWCLVFVVALLNLQAPQWVIYWTDITKYFEWPWPTLTQGDEANTQKMFLENVKFLTCYTILYACIEDSNITGKNYLFIHINQCHTLSSCNWRINTVPDILQHEKLTSSLINEPSKPNSYWNSSECIIQLYDILKTKEFLWYGKRHSFLTLSTHTYCKANILLNLDITPNSSNRMWNSL